MPRTTDPEQRLPGTNRFLSDPLHEGRTKRRGTVSDERTDLGASSPVVREAAAWTIITGTGALVLGRSNHEFAVYDSSMTYGRWPLTPEGERYARETYEAHRQSLAHGLAYSATGYQDPERLGLPTEPVMKSQTYASPMSYVGSTRRIVAWAKKAGVRNAGIAVLVWSAAVLAMLFMWTFLLFWYFIAFGLFGVFVFPFRAIRRSQRKSQHVQRQTLATQQAMLQQQQAMFQQMANQQVAMRQVPVAPPIQPPTPPQLPPQP
jgi:hypothetical protein